MSVMPHALKEANPNPTEQSCRLSTAAVPSEPIPWPAAACVALPSIAGGSGNRRQMCSGQWWQQEVVRRRVWS